MHKIINKLTPPQILTFGFLVIILLGAFLLTLPISHTHASVSFLDGLFTAVSATTITGLTTLNTGATWTLFGQLVIIVMIEIGALGFMTFAVLLFAITGRRMDLKSRILAQEALHLNNLADVKSVMRYVISLSVIIQAVGFVLLSFDFIPKFGFTGGLYYAFMQAISAFANAGFTFLPVSLTFFQTDPYALFIFMLLISAGSFGFLVWRDVLLYHRGQRLSLHTRVALVVSGWLTGLAFLGFFLSETLTGHLPAKLSIFDKLMNTLFLAIVPRTAGFEIIPLHTLSMGAIMIIMFLMFVGGTPGSTSGGIKTTTMGILWMQSIAALRGQSDVNFKDRRFSQSIVTKALMLAFISMAFVFLTSLLLALTETIPHNMGIEYIFFEVISAFSTTGFSLGLTPNLTDFGKVVIMLVMFVGRVGLYTVMFSVLNIHHKTKKYSYPTEEVIIG
ncbi:MAG: Trk family potassium uptake protein [Lactobacillaceae bacterium]|jgi:trk system potassium uptake protein TrkH|nr:Trk family potassium uptake protein [Lactobacillaceae bacterium]